MAASNGQKNISLNVDYSSGNSDLSAPACQKYSLEELHSMINNPISAIPIRQNMGHASSQASQESSGKRKRRAPSRQRSEELCGEDMAMLDHDEREAAVRRAKNREAARKSRERKMMQVDNLMTSVKELTTENELLSKCIQEISQQADNAEAETQLMKEQIQAIRVMAASEEDRQIIDRLLENAIAMAHSMPPQSHLPPQVAGQVAKSIRGSSSGNNVEAAQWAGPSSAQSPFMHPYAQQFMTPEEILRAERHSSAKELMQPHAFYHHHLDPMLQQGAEAGSMCGYAANGGNGAERVSGSPGRAHLGLDTTPSALEVGPPLGGHPKRTRSTRGGARRISPPKRVSPPSAESFGGPILLPLPDMRYHQVPACHVTAPQMLTAEGTLDLLGAAAGIPSPDSLLTGSLSSPNASFGSGGSLPLGPMHDLFLDGAPMLPPGAFAHPSSLL